MREIKFRIRLKYFDGSIETKIVTLEDLINGVIGKDFILYSKILSKDEYTGLKDKNGLTDIYEDDIIDIEGRVIGNKYQNNELLKESTNFLIQGFGTADWETTNEEALARGCKYA